MMSDDDFEQAVRRYRPAAPRDDLRARVIAAARAPRSTWRAWIPAAAALIVAVLCYWRAASTLGSLDARVVPFSGAEIDARAALLEDAAGTPIHDEIEWWLWLRRPAVQAMAEGLP